MSAGAAAEPAAAIEATALRKRFGSHEALAGVDLRVAAGEVVGLLGPNGAGKSTFVKLACGLARPTSGTVRVFGEDPRSSVARARIGYLAELFRFPAHLRSDELLRDHQVLAGSEGDLAERDDLLARVGLDDAPTRRRRIGEYSKGMQQRLGIAQALVGSPGLVLLDEPTSALDPSSRLDVRTVIEGLRASGTAVLLNSHLLGEVERVCDRVAIIRRGVLVAEGGVHDLDAASGTVSIETDAGTVTHRGVDRDAVAELVAGHVAAGRRVYRVEAVGSALEQAYLEAVGEDRG
ncbi:MAG: transporter ATP-binding protein [Thermoleophilia bacterium]|nr:transporter ATP-binding protein [Thermoleophilia bacterium]